MTRSHPITNNYKKKLIMAGKTFAEKILDAPVGSIVFRTPDLVLSHDNTSSIEDIFKKMKGEKPAHPDSLVVVLDHNAPPTNAKLANDYQQIRKFAERNELRRFHDVGDGICHQLISAHASPGMLIVGSDSHTCTAGAFNAFATGIDRTETAGIWKNGETWFRVPESLKITLTGHLPEGVYAKDVALYIIGMLGSDGADYLSVEYHGDGIKNLSIADRMTIANMASEMGAKNAVFPLDKVLSVFLKKSSPGVWADDDAVYKDEIEINLSGLYPLVACPHHVDNVKAADEVAGTPVQQALIGTCTNGRMEDLLIAASLLSGKKIPLGFQLLVIPASKEIYLQAISEGIIQSLIEAGANILSPSCGPCLGTGQGIPADGINVISTANRNFPGRMGNKNAAIFLASPATVALSALNGVITSPSPNTGNVFPFHRKQTGTIEIKGNENRKNRNVWSYQDVDNLNTDQMFAGNLTYEIGSADGEKIKPYLFKGFDPSFAEKVMPGDIIVCGENFGCGSSREHPSVGLVSAGVKAVIVKSVSRIFFRSSVNQGLPIIVLPEAVEAYKPGDSADIFFSEGIIKINETAFRFNPLPEKLMQILGKGGLVNSIISNSN